MGIQSLKCRIISLLGESVLDGNYVVFDKNTENIQVLPNFKLHEFLTKNPSDSRTRINLAVIVELNSIRSAWGKPIRITSSYRSKEYNKSVDGATSSAHIKGDALDIQPTDGNMVAFKKLVIDLKKTGGLGFYRTFIHIDCGRTRAWNG